MTRKTYGYIRISREEATSISLDLQRSKILAYAHLTDRGPVEEIICDDGFTGATMSRPGFQQLRSLVETGNIAAVIVAKLDRLTRSLEDVLAIIKLCAKYDTALLSVSETLDTSSSVGRLLVHVLASFGEFERARIQERISDALRHKRQTGKVYGPVPFGYIRIGSYLFIDPKERSAISRMRELRNIGASYRAISDDFNATGPRTHSGKPWSAHTIRAVLLSKKTIEDAA